MALFTSVLAASTIYALSANGLASETAALPAASAFFSLIFLPMIASSAPEALYGLTYTALRQILAAETKTRLEERYLPFK